MRQRLTGQLIGAIFGMIFVVVNAQDPLPAGIGLVLRVLAVLALVGLFVIAVLAVKRTDTTGMGAPTAIPQAGGFGAGYWLVVGAEIVLLIAGLVILRSVNAPQEVNVAWIAFVVGLHLIAFVMVWRQRSIVVPGAILAVFGVAGLVMATTPVVGWVPFVSGVLSGITLLAFSLVFAARELPSRTAAPGRSKV